MTVNTTGAGNAITSISKAGTVITADKGLTFSLGNHLHTGIYEPVFSKNTAFNKNFGTAAGTVAEGNHTHSYLPLSGGTLTGNLTAPTFIGSLTGNATSATKLQTARTIWGQSFDGTGNVTGNMSAVSQIANGGVYLRHTPTSHTVLSAENSSIYLRPKGDTDSVGQCVLDNLGNLGVTGTVTAPTFSGALSGNATTATTATKLGTATVGSTQLPFYLNAGTATAITQADLRIGLFGATAIGSSTAPVYIAANGIATACTSFGGVTGIGTASPLMDGTVAVGTSTLAARQDHRHPVDTSRAAVGQTMYIGTTAVTINRASATLNLTGIGTLAMAGALSGATTIAASTSVTTPKVIFAAAGWSVEQAGTEIQFKYNGVIKQRLLNDGSIVGIGEITAFGATS